MGEPMIMIPARQALRIASQLEAVNTELFPGRAKSFQANADKLKQQIAEQCTKKELNTAIVSARLEMVNEK
jgi:BarA-like signal transduction histidine kinase